ncbi:MAG TPA: aliphatic sulfonate ABC transporter substrate-binding protein [Polyangiaceae bacterium]|nr:aliphatic sulfonate ABC transporter substrate-binding protein [Polyangiaceae bacterium]
MIARFPKALVALFSLLPALLGGCQKQNDEGAAKAAASAAPQVAAPAPKTITPVRIGYQKIGAPFLLKSRSADLDKRLDEKSAKAEWKEFKHGPGVLEAIKAKEVDVGYVGETPPVFAQAGGVDFLYVASDPPAPKAEALIVRKDSPIKSLRDLKGKKVALNRGSNVHYLLVKALESVKLALSDVEVVYLAPGDARPAYDSGKVDAWVIWDPFLAAAENAGSRQLANGEGLVENRLFYVARRQFAEEHPELVRATLDEFKSLSDWESKNPEEASKILAESSGVAYEALLLSEKRHAYGILPVTDAVLDAQQHIADVFRKLELIPKDIKTRDAFLPAVVYADKP